MNKRIELMKKENLINSINRLKDQKDSLGNPMLDTDKLFAGVAIGRYKFNTIYDKGSETETEYRYYARGKINEGFNRGPVTANGKTLQQLRREINEDSTITKTKYNHAKSR